MTDNKKEKEMNENKELETMTEDFDTETLENTEENAPVKDGSNDEKYMEIIESLNKEVAKYKDAYVRSVADFENYKKRSVLEVEKANKYAVSSFAKDILNVADALTRAIKSMPPKENRHEQLKNFALGAEMTLDELHNTLSRYKIEPIKSMGEIFNPNYHKVIQEREDDSLEAGTIVEEWQIGYMIADRVLREAMVIVSKKSEKKKDSHIDTNA